MESSLIELSILNINRRNYGLRFAMRLLGVS